MEMFSRAKLFCRLRFFENVLHRCESTDSRKTTYSPLFFDKRVQELLRKMTNSDLEKVFKAKPHGVELKPPVYKFMTNEQLRRELESCRQRADYLLQIPPLVNVSKEEIEVLSNDPVIDGHDVHHSKIVCVDISPDLVNEERQVVVREPNGVLRTASKFERHRVNQVYFPMAGRELEMPKMFEDEFLKAVIDREDYSFILDKACVQFEPDEAMYHKVISATYEAINERDHFERLHSTRHFGSLVFYLVTHKRIDNLLLNNIQNERIEDAHSLVELYHIINPDCQSAKSNSKGMVESIRDYIMLDAHKKAVLELALQEYVNKEKDKKETKTGIQKAHGV